MSSTVGARYVAGSILATDADLPVLTVGFKPSKIVIHNLTTHCKIEWNDALASGRCIKTGADGARSVITGGVEVDSDAGNFGFMIPNSLADINDTADEELMYECWG